MFNKIKPLWAAMAVAVGLIGLQLVGGSTLNYYSHHKATIITLTEPSVIHTTTDLTKPASTIAAGQGVVIENFVHVDATGCYAVFNNWLDGPVRYQFPVNRTYVIYTKPENRHALSFFELPPHLPPGKYHWHVTTYPTCANYDLSPTMLDTGAEFTVTPAGS